MSSISDDDDSGPSLKELVTKNLEANGILGKLQAQLRASVFLILEEEFQEKHIPLLNEKTHECLNSHVGKIAVSIIQDFLQCLNLEFTLAVFSPETKSVFTERSINRQYLTKELGRKWKDNRPILFQIIEDSQRKETENKDLHADNADIQSTRTSKNSPNVESTSEKDVGDSKSVDSVKSETRVPRIPAVVNVKGQPTKTDLTEEEETTSENVHSQRELVESSESKNLTKRNSTQSGSNDATKTSNNNSSSSSTNSSENASNHSTLTSNPKSEKNTLSGIEKEYEEEFSSLSEIKNQTVEDSTANGNDASDGKEDVDKRESNKSEDKANEEEEESEIEEAVETAEDIEEDISSLDDLLSSNSEISNQTRDISASKENKLVDYEESL